MQREKKQLKGCRDRSTMGVQMNTQGQQLGIDMANNFMLMTLFSILADMGGSGWISVRCEKGIA
ncbi:hypothetical protein ACFIOY_28840 [Bradyrhizobium sp. TZ2]